MTSNCCVTRITHHTPLTTRHSPLRPAFTLVELLVTITIIGILAGMMFGGLQLAREAAREQATKATIAKLHTIIMKRYESYMTRRVPITIPAGTPTAVAAQMRLDAIRDLMRMEMPDARLDIVDSSDNKRGPLKFPWESVAQQTGREPALFKLYKFKPPTSDHDSAQCLYLIVSLGSPEAMEQFSQSEIGMVDGNKPVFIDGWGRPIAFLRWAPGFVRPASDIQTGNSSADSDPFDSRRVDYAYDKDVWTNNRGYHLIPLICSGGSSKTIDIRDLDQPTRSIILGQSLDASNHIDLYTNKTLGAPLNGTSTGCITNHHIEAR